MPGFEYRVSLAIPRRQLFQGRALRLVSIGIGYGKRMTFAPDPGCLNDNKNMLWSDSHPDGVGFEPRAIHVGQKFHIAAGGLRLGEADVFRVDNPQIEEGQELVNIVDINHSDDTKDSKLLPLFKVGHKPT